MASGAGDGGRGRPLGPAWSLSHRDKSLSHRNKKKGQAMSLPFERHVALAVNLVSLRR
jgi:hypothetical protein